MWFSMMFYSNQLFVFVKNIVEIAKARISRSYEIAYSNTIQVEMILVEAMNYI